MLCVPHSFGYRQNSRILFKTEGVLLFLFSMRALCLLGFLLGAAFTGMSASDRFVNYSIDKGLPSSQAYDIVQLKKGAMLFATDNGLSEYDGYQFKNYDLQDGLTDHSVFNFWPQPDGKIWCTTYNKKLFYYDENKNRFFTYPFNDKIEQFGFSELIVITCFYIAPDSSLFLSFVNSTGYLRISRKGDVITNTVKLPEAGSEMQTALCVDADGNSFFFTIPYHEKASIHGFKNEMIYSGERNRGDDFVKAVFHKDLSTAVFTSPDSTVFIREHHRITIPNEKPAIAVGCFDEKFFWIGYRYGGYALFTQDGIRTQSFLNTHSVNNIKHDHEQGIWVSTLDAGLFHRNKVSVTIFSTPDPNDFWVNNLIKDKDGTVWAAYYNGSIYQCRNDSMICKYHSIDFKPALLAYNESRDEVWASVSGKLIDFKSNKSYQTGLLPIKIVFTIDSLAMLAYRNVLFYNKGVLSSSLMTGMRINDLCMFRGTYLLATNYGVFEIKNGTVQSIYPMLQGKRITDLECTGDILVVSTKGDGLFVKYENEFVQFTRKNGLISNSITKAMAENRQTLWLCTNAGLNRLRFFPGGMDVRTITIKDGLPGNEVNDVLLDGDAVWVATKNGLCRLPSADPIPENINYFLSVPRVCVNDSVLDISDLTALHHTQSRIEFFLQGHSYNDHQKLKYRFKLEGLEKNWNYSENRSVLYSSLPPGHYRFIAQVKGTNMNWESSVVALFVVVHPPFWKTPFFITGSIILLLIIIYLFFRYNILSYNRDIVRELLRQLLKRVKRNAKYVVFREQGKEIRIQSDSIRYVKSEGNYLEIYTDTKKHLVRCKIGDFTTLVPDPLEFLRINRSYIVRIDKISEKGRKEVLVGSDRIPVGETYADQIKKIKF